jgi:hypothetical protein
VSSAASSAVAGPKWTPLWLLSPANPTWQFNRRSATHPTTLPLPAACKIRFHTIFLFLRFQTRLLFQSARRKKKELRYAVVASKISVGGVTKHGCL